jgi:hypothetical protein
MLDENPRYLFVHIQYLVRCTINFDTGRLCLRIHEAMAHSFKTISMGFGASGLIFEGLKGICLGRDETFCQGFPGVNPLRSDHGDARWNFF